MDKHSSASYTSSSLFTLLGAMTLEQWALAVGILFTVLTFAVNTYYKHKMFELEKNKTQDGK